MWIEHNGEGWPTEAKRTDRVIVKFRDGMESKNLDDPWTVEEWDICWRHDPDLLCWSDIVAYRVVSDD